jgi:hypothetical protein
MLRHRVVLGALLSTLLTAQSALAVINFVGADLTSVPPQADYMAIGDLNNDGLQDVVTVSPASKNVTTYLAQPSAPSRFAPARSVQVGNTLRGFALGDLNRDGRLDVVVADQAGDGVHVLLGKGDGTYQDPYLISVPNSRNVYGVAIANFDQSGGPDLAVIDRRLSKVFVLLNDNGSPPRFRRGGDFVVGPGPEQVLGIDLNKDGLPDIVTLDLGGPRVKDVSVTLFKRVQQGFPEFDKTIQYVVGENPSEMLAADFNNDGVPDIAMLNRPAGSGRVSEIDVLMSTGTGVLLPPPGIPVPCPFFTNGQPCKGLSLAQGDFDGNGTIDLMVAVTDPRSRGSNLQLIDAMQAFAGRGDGGFVPGGVFAIQKAPRSMGSGDVTGDGKPDVMIGAQRSLSLQAFVNVGSPGGLPIGDLCQTGDECLSARCTNGVCCAAECSASEVCNVPGREGTCVPEGDPMLTDCVDETDCGEARPFCVDNFCCDTPCDGGTCTQPGFLGVCLPLLEDGAECVQDSKCASGFCSDPGRCCKERCDGGYCDEFGVCSPLASNGSPCGEDAQCASNVCDAFDLICCNRRCLENDEFCNPDGFCTPFGGTTPSPGVTLTPNVVTGTPTPRATPVGNGELCSIESDCLSENCVNNVCCEASECGPNQHCAEGSGRCVEGGTPTRTPTRTALPTEPGGNPCQPNPCAKGQKCVVLQDGVTASCITASSSSGCSTGGGDGSGNLLVVAAMPLLLWAGRRWQLARATVRARRPRH